MPFASPACWGMSLFMTPFVVVGLTIPLVAGPVSAAVGYAPIFLGCWTAFARRRTGVGSEATRGGSGFGVTEYADARAPVANGRAVLVPSRREPSTSTAPALVGGPIATGTPACAGDEAAAPGVTVVQGQILTTDAAESGGGGPPEVAVSRSFFDRIVSGGQRASSATATAPQPLL